jgi:hypothetical protein
VFGVWGLGIFSVGFVISAYLTVLRLMMKIRLSDRPLLLLGVLMILMGVQLISMGLLGEIVIRTYHEAQNKPIYVIREILDDESGDGDGDGTG